MEVSSSVRLVREALPEILAPRQTVLRSVKANPRLAKAREGSRRLAQVSEAVSGAAFIPSRTRVPAESSAKFRDPAWSAPVGSAVQRPVAGVRGVDGDSRVQPLTYVGLQLDRIGVCREFLELVSQRPRKSDCHLDDGVVVDESEVSAIAAMAATAATAAIARHAAGIPCWSC